MPLQVVLPTQIIGNMNDTSVIVVTDTFDGEHVEFRVKQPTTDTVRFYVYKDDLKELTKLVCKRR